MAPLSSSARTPDRRVFARPKSADAFRRLQMSSLELSPSFRELRSPSCQRPSSSTEVSPSGALAPPVEFLPLQRIPARDSGCLHGPGSHSRTACAFRFSRPHDALLRHVPAGLVSCRIRSWGFPFRALLLPCSSTPSSDAPAPLPLLRSSFLSRSPRTPSRNRRITPTLEARWR
jgi:hypothetical protein